MGLGQPRRGEGEGVLVESHREQMPYLRADKDELFHYVSVPEVFFSKLVLPTQPATNAKHLSPDLSKVCLPEMFDFKDTSVQYWSIIPPGGGSRKLL